MKEVHYLPKAYNSVQEYMDDVNSSTQPVDPIKLTLDENGNTIIQDLAVIGAIHSDKKEDVPSYGKRVGF